MSADFIDVCFQVGTKLVYLSLYNDYKSAKIGVKAMRIALFIFGAIAVVYLVVKGFKQVIEESRQKRHDQDSDHRLK